MGLTKKEKIKDLIDGDGHNIRENVKQMTMIGKMKHDFIAQLSKLSKIKHSKTPQEKIVEQTSAVERVLNDQ